MSSWGPRKPRRGSDELSLVFTFELRARAQSKVRTTPRREKIKKGTRNGEERRPPRLVGPTGRILLSGWSNRWLLAAHALYNEETRILG